MIFTRDSRIPHPAFTLVELIVVLVIVAMLTALAVTSLRGESPASALNRQTLALEAWCAAVRYRCAEDGADYAVRMLPEQRLFYALPVETAVGEERAEAPPPTSGPLRLELPENFELATVEGAEDAARETEYVEVFRFFPGGGGVCVNRPVLRIDKLARYFDMAFLSGRMLSFDGDGCDVEVRR